ncbi:hypothetical protein GY12_11350 [Micrococcus luteus]|nr:hypothetical protein GY12_11350 [Micrococcus luteus]
MANPIPPVYAAAARARRRVVVRGDLHDLLTYVHPTPHEVHVRPAQPEDLAAAQPEIGGDVEQRRQALPGVRERVQERACLRRRPRLHLRPFLARHVQVPGRVPRELPLPHRSRQSRAQGGPHPVDRGRAPRPLGALPVHVVASAGHDLEQRVHVRGPQVPQPQVPELRP